MSFRSLAFRGHYHLTSRPLKPLHVPFRDTTYSARKQLSSAAMAAQFSSGSAGKEVTAEAEKQLQIELDRLLGNGWALDEGKKGVTKTFYFKAYTKVMDLHHAIGTRSKSKSHHPTMTSTTGWLLVHWTTHAPPGFSAKDAYMARYTDERAAEIGPVEKSEAQKCGPLPTSRV